MNDKTTSGPPTAQESTGEIDRYLSRVEAEHRSGATLSRADVYMLILMARDTKIATMRWDDCHRVSGPVYAQIRDDNKRLREWGESAKVTLALARRELRKVVDLTEYKHYEGLLGQLDLALAAFPPGALFPESLPTKLYPISAPKPVRCPVCGMIQDESNLKDSTFACSYCAVESEFE